MPVCIDTRAAGLARAGLAADRARMARLDAKHWLSRTRAILVVATLMASLLLLRGPLGMIGIMYQAGGTKLGVCAN